MTPALQAITAYVAGNVLSEDILNPEWEQILADPSDDPSADPTSFIGDVIGNLLGGILGKKMAGG